MNDLFKDIKEETLEEGIKVFGPKSIYTPGIHEIVDTNIYVYDVTYGDSTWTTAEVVVVDSKGATLTNQLKTEAKGEQTQSALVRFIYGVALVTGKQAEVVPYLKNQFNKLPLVSYEDSFKKKVKARHIKLLSNSKYYNTTTTEVSGDANGIYTKQIINPFSMFRHSDKASTSEIKDGSKDKFGDAFEYWEDQSVALDKTRVAWHKDGAHDNEVTRETVAFLSAGGTLDKATRQKLQDGYTAAEAFGKVSPEPSEQGDESDVTTIDTNMDEIPF